MHACGRSGLAPVPAPATNQIRSTPSISPLAFLVGPGASAAPGLFTFARAPWIERLPVAIVGAWGEHSTKAGK